MNVDKARKRIAKQVKKGFHGYPLISLAYFGKTSDIASEVVISFVMEEGDTPQEQKFHCEHDAREDETIQSTLVKIIERANAATVTEIDGVSLVWSPRFYERCGRKVELGFVLDCATIT